MRSQRFIIALLCVSLFALGATTGALGCTAEPSDPHFCEGEWCGSVSGSGPGGGSTTEAPFMCGEKKCLPTPCYTGWHCDDSVKSGCLATDYTEDFDDGNACTIEQCDPIAGWLHVPIPESQWDDGDDCTIDECDQTLGVVHVDNCD